MIIQRRLSLSDNPVPRFHLFNKSRGSLEKYLCAGIMNEKSTFSHAKVVYDKYTDSNGL